MLISNPKKAVNKTFFGFAMSGFFWLSMNLLTNLSADPTYSLLFARMGAIAGVMTGYSFLVFCLSYANDPRLNKSFLTKLGIVPIVILFLTLTPLNISSIDAYGKNANTGPLYLLLVPAVLFYFAYGLIILYKLNKHATEIQRARLKYIFWGTVIAAIPGVIANGLLPMLGRDSASFYGPNVVVILAFFMTIAITKFGLLDIRLVAVRSLVYLFAITTLAVLFVVGVFAVSALLAGDDSISVSLQAAYIILALSLSFAFQPIKGYFNRISNKYFYMDAYDPQVFLDELNKALLTNIDVMALVKSAAWVIEHNLKVDHVAIVLRATAYEKQRIVVYPDPPQKFKDIDYDSISDIGSMMKKRMIVVSELEDSDAILHSTFAQNNIGLMTKLSPAIKHDTQGVGFMVLSNKRSGNVFTKSDVDILRIISSELVIAIQNALRFEEIEKFNVTLQQKIDDATKELQRTNEKLKALDEAKDDFISMASHQLRTPLTSIKGYVSMILEGDAGEINDQQRRFLSQAFTSSQRMVYLIADLLNVSRLKTGKFMIESIPTYLPELVETEISQLYETAAARGLELNFQKPSTFTTLNLDETKIRQVVMNFADNAIYYTPKGGRIDITLQETDLAVEFTVTDTGIGVPKAEQHHLFTKFYRAGNARKARPDGTGLGLFMAKKVIVAQGGSIIFRSEEGKGSTFGFTLPKAKLLPKVITSADEKVDK